MSIAFDQRLRNLNDCGCCEGLSVQTPVRVENRPGLKAIMYRVGTHSRFKETMLNRLASYYKLRELKTRENDDFSIALLDAWAAVADVFSFYQERIANECYLRTATERLSLSELARLIGYELRPGVAASTYLAFEMEEIPGAKGKVMIEKGTKVQSIPGPGQQPQTFETVEKIEARAEWNAIKPRMTERQTIEGDKTIFFFKGVSTGLKPGDGLLLTPEDNKGSVFRRISKVTPNHEQSYTEIELENLPLSLGIGVMTTMNPSKSNPGTKTLQFKGNIINYVDLNSTIHIANISMANVFAAMLAAQPPEPKVLAFRINTFLFGHNAPNKDSLPHNMREGEYILKPDPKDPNDLKLIITEYKKGPYNKDWADAIQLKAYPSNQLAITPKRILLLDNVYPTIIKGSWIVLRNNDTNSAIACKVNENTEITVSDFTLTLKVSSLTLEFLSDVDRTTFDGFKIRSTTVFAQSEELPLARKPLDKPISGSEIELDGLVTDLFEGQSIIISGELENDRGNYATEYANITKAEVIGNDNFDRYTRITLNKKMSNDYVRSTVTIFANVALATHGETVQEIMGGGDLNIPFQHFVLSHVPLTYVSSPLPAGAESTLEVRVNDLLWKEVPTLYGHGPDERIYTTRTTEEGRTIVQFGDGWTGARLPTGQNNVRVKCRKGSGLEGLLEAGQLSMLMSRPPGAKGVINPGATSGAKDRESLIDARRNAPLTVMTLDRAVSLRDYQDFAQAFAGVAKALATWTWVKEARGVFITVAGPGGDEIKDDSLTLKNLLSALRKSGDPQVPILVKSYRKAFFRIKGEVKVNPDYLTDRVLADVDHKLRDSFSFEAREFGQAVTLSEVTAFIKDVPGVIAANIEFLYRTGSSPKRNPKLDAALPQTGGKVTLPAELLTIGPNPIELEVMP